MTSSGSQPGSEQLRGGGRRQAEGTEAQESASHPAGRTLARGRETLENDAICRLAQEKERRGEEAPTVNMPWNYKINMAERRRFQLWGQGWGKVNKLQRIRFVRPKQTDELKDSISHPSAL